jgi:hypothetical protein
MVKTLAGVVVGLVVMFVLMFVGLAAAWAVLGVDGALEPGTWMTTTRWNLIGLAVSFVACLAAGAACSRIGGRPGAARILALIVLVAGIPPLAQALREDPPQRPEQVTMLEVPGRARMPLWNAVLNPLVGVAGVLAGGRKKK